MRPSKKAIYSGLAALGLVAGAAGISAAASGTPSPAVANVPTQADPTPTPDPGLADTPADEAAEGPESEANEGPENEADEANEQDESPEYTSSITADQAADGISEADENAALAPLATVTSDEASAAAIEAHPGTVVSTQLENENGSIVYEVVIDTGSGTIDVKVDAGNGTVLGSDSGDEAEADEANEGSDADGSPGAADDD